MTRRPLLLGLDFDVTLDDIRDDRGEAGILSAATLLARASELEGVVLAILSGRDADDLVKHVSPGAYLIASHGMEVRAPGGILLRDAQPLSAEIDLELRNEIAASGLRLETKKYGLAVHWRGIPYVAIAPVIEMFRSWARRLDLTLMEGHGVVEARSGSGSKEEALHWLAGVIGAGWMIYVGDDVMNVEALQFATLRGRDDSAPAFRVGG